MAARQPVLVTSFRLHPDGRTPLAGQDTFVHGLLDELDAAGRFDVTVLTVKARDTPAEIRSGHRRMLFLATPESATTDLVGLHRLAPAEVLRVASAYGRQVGRFLETLPPGPPPLLLNNDLVEAGYVQAARARGCQVVTMLHYLFSAMAHAQVDARELERYLHHVPMLPPARAVARLMVDHKIGYGSTMRLIGGLRRTYLDRLFPAAFREPFEHERLVLHESDAVVVPSGAMRGQILQAYPRIEPDRVRVVPWAVELPLPDPDRVALLRGQLGVQPGERVLLTMSRLSPEKGLDVLLEALAIWEVREPEAAARLHLLVCGTDDLSIDTEHAPTLRARAAALRRVRVHFRGYVSGADKSAHFGVADLFALPSLYEAYGLALVEALQSGLPVLASDTDGSRQLLEPAYGVRVPYQPAPARAANLAAGLQELWHADLPAMARAARVAGGRHRWPQVLAAILAGTSAA